MIESRLATVLVATPRFPSTVSTGCTTAPPLRPVRWAVMNPSTSTERTSSAGLPTDVKNTFKS
jgi:hypothetical protein